RALAHARARDRREHGRAGDVGVVEPEGVAVLVRHHTLDVDLAAGDVRAGAVGPGEVLVEDDLPAVEAGRRGCARDARPEVRGRDRVVLVAAGPDGESLPARVEVRAARAQAARLVRVALAVTVQRAAPFEHGLPAGHRGAEIAGEVVVRRDVVVGARVLEVVE